MIIWLCYFLSYRADGTRIYVRHACLVVCYFLVVLQYQCCPLFFRCLRLQGVLCNAETSVSAKLLIYCIVAQTSLHLYSIFFYIADVVSLLCYLCSWVCIFVLILSNGSIYIICVITWFQDTLLSMSLHIYCSMVNPFYDLHMIAR